MTLDPFGVIKSVQNIAAKHIALAISKKASVPVSDYVPFGVVDDA